MFCRPVGTKYRGRIYMDIAQVLIAWLVLQTRIDSSDPDDDETRDYCSTTPAFDLELSMVLSTPITKIANNQDVSKR